MKQIVSLYWNPFVFVSFSKKNHCVFEWIFNEIKRNNVNTNARCNSKGENHPLKIVAKFSRF